MGAQGDLVEGRMHYCGSCRGILASDRWLASNMRQTNLRNLRKSVFDGEPAGYRCPTCQGEMVKGPVTTTQGSSIEVDGCLKCGSLWFDNREIEPFSPDIREKARLPDDSNPILPAISSGMTVAKTVIADLFGAVGSLAGRNADSEE
jgi:hypothetical protein